MHLFPQQSIHYYETNVPYRCHRLYNVFVILFLENVRHDNTSLLLFYVNVATLNFLCNLKITSTKHRTISRLYLTFINLR